MTPNRDSQRQKTHLGLPAQKAPIATTTTSAPVLKVLLSRFARAFINRRGLDSTHTHEALLII